MGSASVPIKPLKIIFPLLCSLDLLQVPRQINFPFLLPCSYSPFKLFNIFFVASLIESSLLSVSRVKFGYVVFPFKNLEKASASFFISSSVSPDNFPASSYGIPFSIATFTLFVLCDRGVFVCRIFRG